MPDKSEPYDLARPFDADELMDGFTEEVREHRVDPDSPLGRAMAAYRERLARDEVEQIDPETFTVTPIPVEPDDGPIAEGTPN
jgi:hypothetical protein